VPLFSLPTINWLRFPDADDPAAVPIPARRVSELLRAAASAGFRAVGVDALSAGTLGVDAGDHIGELLRQHRLVCTEVGVLAVRPGADAGAAELAKLAVSTGARTCVTVADLQAGRDLVAALEACAEVLTDAGVRMALEFLPYGPLANLADAVAVCDAVGWERCGVLLDTWHFFNSGRPWELLRSLSGAQIALVQINDAPPPNGSPLRHESRFRRVPPGAGTFALVEFVATLESIGYDGVVSPEVLSRALIAGDVEDTARALRGALLAYWPVSEDPSLPWPPTRP
jgi:sugar phosphate isomerase/epimerase